MSRTTTRREEKGRGPREQSGPVGGRWRGVFAGLALSGLLSGCGILSPGDDGDLERLARAEAEWAEAGPTRYRVTVERLCFCPLVTARITVESGEIVAVDFPGVSGDEAQEEWREAYVLDYFHSVEDVFPYLRSVLERDPDSFRADYRAGDGLPLEVEVDPWRNAVDDEWTLRYRDLEPLSAPST